MPTIKTFCGHLLSVVCGASGGIYLYNTGAGDFLLERLKRKTAVTSWIHDVHSDTLETAQGILKFGEPKTGDDILYYKNHVLNYNHERRIPRWVMEHLTKNNLNGGALRSLAHFGTDPRIPTMFRSQNSDYKESGWSRGRLAPAGDNMCSQDALENTFLLSNVVPQNLDLNTGYWNRLEIFCRDLAQRYPDVYVVTGPLFIAREDVSRKDKYYIRHYVIGRSEVHVPTHLFKVILVDRGSDGPPLLGCFVVPNQPVEGDSPLQNYEVSLEYIEQKSGLSLLPKLCRDLAQNLCQADGCQLMSLRDFEVYMTQRRLDAARTVNTLDTVWSEFRRKRIKVPEELKLSYTDRRKELEVKQSSVHTGGEA